MRKLATVRQVSNIRPIEGKDLIVQVNIDGWNVIVKKDEFQEGDLCVYVEIDSQLPAKPEFEFLAKKNYIIKTMKMAGVRSEGIVFPLSILPKPKKAKLGDDVTKALGIKQYNKEEEVETTFIEKIVDAIDTRLRKFAWYRKLTIKSKRTLKKASSFPYWIRKTDEERIQNKKYVLDSDAMWIATEKLDGSSATFGYRKTKEGEEYVVCSRNRLITEDSVWTTISKQYEMEKKLKFLFEWLHAKESIVVQGEIIAPNIQGNKYKVENPYFYAFNLIIDGVSIDILSAMDYFEQLRLETVPYLHNISLQGKTVDGILDLATFQSEINPDTLAEGLVFRTFDREGKLVDSFKAVSPRFLILHKE